MNAHIDIDIGYVTIFENYLIMVINEGENIKVESNNILIDIAKTFYANKDFVYITNRLNSYSVDPAIYHETKKIDNLIGLAVVSKNALAINNAAIEKLFFDKPFEMFNELNAAISWANSLFKK